MEQYSTNLKVQSEKENLFSKDLKVIQNSTEDNILFPANHLVKCKIVHS